MNRYPYMTDWSQTFFDRHEDVAYSVGMFEEFLPGRRTHHHARVRWESGDGYIRYWCEDCDTFQWIAR